MIYSYQCEHDKDEATCSAVHLTDLSALLEAVPVLVALHHKELAHQLERAHNELVRYRALEAQ